MAKRKPVVAGAPYIGWVTPSLTVDDVTQRWMSYVAEDMRLVQQALFGSVARAVDINATNCARQRLMLLSRATLGSKSRGLSRDEHNYFTGRTPRGKALKSLAWSAGADPEEVVEHEVLDLLRAPNPLMDPITWFYQIFWYAEAVGRCYVLTEERAAGVPTSLYTLAPQYTRPQLNKRNFITGYLYGRDQGDQVEYPADVVSYYRTRPSPWHPAGAYTWAMTVRPQAEVEAAAMASETARWRNGGRPDATYEISELVPPDQVPAIDAAIRRQIQGVENSGKNLILQHVKVVESTTKPHEMNYVQGLELAERQIMHAAGIPEPLFRMNSANLASAEVAMRQYATQCVLPRVTSFAAFLTNNILPLFGVEPGEMWFEYADPSPENTLEQEAMYRNGYTAGLIYPNEYRRVLELDPVPDEQNKLREGNAQAPQTSAWGGQGVVIGRVGGTGESGPVRDAAAAVEKSVAAGECVCAGCGSGGRAGKVGCVPDALEVAPQLKKKVVTKRIAARNFEDVTGLPDELVQPVNQFAADMQSWYQETYPRVAQGEGRGVAIPPEQEAKLNAIIEQNLRRLYVAGGIDFARQIGDEVFSVSDPAVSAYVREHGLELATSVRGTVLEDVRGAISRGLEEGRTYGEIQSDISVAAPDLAAYQSERIARTEGSFAYNDASRQAASELGATGKRWMLAGGPCPLCESVAATYSGAIPINEPFVDGDWSGMTAPRHPNCRCTVEYEWEGEE